MIFLMDDASFHVISIDADESLRHLLFQPHYHAMILSLFWYAIVAVINWLFIFLLTFRMFPVHYFHYFSYT